MAFKKVTTGLTSVNAVIDEILDFVQNDLAAPWTLVSNKNPTAGAVSPQASGASGRNTWISKAGSDPETGRAFKGIESPDPPELMYVGMRTVSSASTAQTDGQPAIELHATGYRRNQSPIENFMNGTGQEGFESNKGWGRTLASIDAIVNFEGYTAPFTAMWLFGPNQTSPEDINIPNYVYFVVEISPGRYTHGMFGEFKKYVPFRGGWGIFCHNDGRSITDVSSSTNGSMWNDNKNKDEGGDCFLCADIDQEPQPGIAPQYTRWFAHDNQLAGGTATGEHYFMHMWGHIRNYDFMAVTSQAVLSGFYPLVTPLIGLGDSKSAASPGPNESDQDIMMACYPEDFFLGDITPYEPGVEVDVGGVTVVPFPIHSKLTSGLPRSNFGGYFYRKRA